MLVGEPPLPLPTVNVINIAPSQAGVVMGITHTMANFAGAVSNSVTSLSIIFGWINMQCRQVW